MIQDTETEFIYGGNIGPIRGLPADQCNGGPLISATLNLMQVHGTTSSRSWILLKRVQTKRRTREIFAMKSYANSDERIEDMKALNLEMSHSTLFHITTLLMLLATDHSSTRNTVRSLVVPTKLQTLCIKHWPSGQDARDSIADSLLAVKSFWINTEMLTTRSDVTDFPGNAQYLFIPNILSVAA